MAIDYKSPIIILWNTDSSGNPVSEEILNESKQVVQNTIVLTQIPDKFYRVLITEFVEIEQHEEITSETQFKVNYQNGIITFHPSQEGQTINIDKYFGRGVIFTPASRIYTSVDSSGDITQTLYDIIELGKSAIDNLEELDIIVSNAQSIIDNAKYIGEYDELLSYKKNNTVSLNGYSYLAFQDVPVAVSPPTPPIISNDYWGMVSAKGDKGDVGVGLDYNWNNTQLGIKREDEAEYQYTDLKGEKGDKGDDGVNWKGEYSSVVNYIADDVVENAGSSWICISPTVGNSPPTLPTTSNTWWELFVKRGLDGEGAGDMLKADYDSNNDGKVDEADIADTLTNMQSSVANIDNAVEKTHEHSNKTVIDKFTEVSGELLYDSNPVGEVTQDDLDGLAGVGRTTETVKGNADAIASHKAENANKAHGGFKGALLRKVVAQSIPNGVFTFVNWESVGVVYDTSIFFNPINPTRFTIPSGVSKVKLKANTKWNTNAVGRRFVDIRKNGAATFGAAYSENMPAGQSGNHISTAVLQVIEGDYFELRVLQDSGGALDLVASGDVWFSLEVIE